MKRNGHWLLIIGIIVLGKVTGFLKDVMLTFFHGISVTTDAYFLSSAITSLLHTAIYLSIPVVVVPLYVRLIEAGDRIESDRKMTGALIFFAAVSFGLTSIGILAAPDLLRMFAPDVDDSVYSTALSFLPIMSATFALSSIVAVSNSIQTVNKLTLPSYLVPLVNNAVFCIGLLVFSESSEFYKILILGIVSWIILVLLNQRSARKWFSRRFESWRSNLPNKTFLLLLLPAIISFYVEQVNSFVGVYFASDLGAGSISVLTYANKLSLIILSVFLVYLTASLFPKMATVASRGDKDELSKYIVRIVSSIIVVGAPLILFMVVFANDVVEILFQRGKFAERDALAVAAVFSIAIIALPFSLIRDVMNRVYFSFNNTVMPVFLSGFALLINAALSILLYRQYELAGLASAAVISVSVNSIVVFALVQRSFGLKILRPIMRTIAICAFAIFCSYYFLAWLDGMIPQYWLLQIVPLLLFYFALLIIARDDEALLLVRYARSSIRKSI